MIVFYSLRFETPPTWRTRSPYLYPRGRRWSSYKLRHWVPSSSPPTTRRATVEASEPASTGVDSSYLMVAGPRHTDSARTAQRTPIPTALLLLRACLLRPLPNNGSYLRSFYLATIIVNLSLPSNNSTCHSVFIFIYSNRLNRKQGINGSSTGKWACYREVYSLENKINTYMKHYSGQVLLKFSSFGNKWSFWKYSQTSVHELNSFLKVVRKPKLFSP
jgi:hypothetical protein